MTVGIMYRLSSASKAVTDNNLELKHVSYIKTGATFEGKFEDYKREGKGIFSWPDGSKYEGYYVNSLRHGQGTQVWSDGSSYDGEFVNNLRQGQGTVHFKNGEEYAGSFFKDRRHGKGTYSWPDGSSFSGMFYMDKKEGYGTFTFSNGNIFKGLYKEDERYGPGVLRYTDGTEDVGLWHGERLIRLCTQTDNAFSIATQTQFEYDLNKNITYIDLIEKTEDNTLQPPAILDYSNHTEPDITKRVHEIYNESLDSKSLAIDTTVFDLEFFKDMKQEGFPNSGKVQVWNKTPDMINLQKFALKHDMGKDKLDLDIDDVVNNERSKFKPSGVLERQSEELILAASAGHVETIDRLLHQGNIHPDVSDSNGHTPLIAAAVNWHIEVINLLLNNGADVNKLNNEGCSALSAGSVFYYPPEGFVYNIAERYMQPPADDRSQASNEDKSVHADINDSVSEEMMDGTKTDSNSFIQKPDDDDRDETQMRKIVDTSDDEEANEVVEDGEPSKEFESNTTVKDYKIEVSDAMIERCATNLSQNAYVTDRGDSVSTQMSKARKLAIEISQHKRMRQTLDLLLKRGANPNASDVPMAVLFFAVKSADVEMVKQLLLHGASSNCRLTREKGELSPLHIAVAIPGEAGVQMTQLLLDALADPDAHAVEDDSYKSRMLEEDWCKDVVSEESRALSGGRTALHIACSRDDDNQNACKIVRLLLQHRADASLMCNGFSPLALAIASGNDLAIDELLFYGANPSQSLTHGVGSALCVASSTEFEHRRAIADRLQLIDKLVKAGANILAPIQVGQKRFTGTAVDYAYHMFNQDRRIAHIPYHALTPAEREIYNARRRLLGYIGDVMRNKAVERERKRTEDEIKLGNRSVSRSPNFVYIGAGARLPPGVRAKSGNKALLSQVQFETVSGDQIDAHREKSPHSTRSASPTRKPLVKYCYECGRSVGVRLTACTRCKEVYYCSKACKLKAWNSRHKDECIRVGARSRSPSPRSARKKSPKEKGDKIDKTQSDKTLKKESKRPNSERSFKFSTSDQDEFVEKWNSGYANSKNKDDTSDKEDEDLLSEKIKDEDKQPDKERKIKNKNKFKLPEIAVERASDKKLPPKKRKETKLPDIYNETDANFSQSKDNSFTDKNGKQQFSGNQDRKLANHKFRTGSPPNYEYVYIDNYVHN